jgi:dehydrogenase/reductase SDR family member 1
MPTALVTGASRGVGRGAAIGLAECGFKVFATGRAVAQADVPGAITPIPCDHLRDDQTAAAFTQVAEGLDVLVNSAWGGYEQMNENGQFTWALPFWEQPMHRWVSMMDSGVRAAFVAASHAARIMLPQKRGLIVNHQPLGRAEAHRQCNLRNFESRHGQDDG